MQTRPSAAPGGCPEATADNESADTAARTESRLRVPAARQQVGRWRAEPPARWPGYQGAGSRGTPLGDPASLKADTATTS
jgi:hypothetical protein